MAGGAEIKGHGFTSFVESTRDVLGTVLFEKVVSALPDATRKLVNRPPLPVTWLNADHYFVFIRTVARVAFAGDNKGLRAIARKQMTNDLSGIYRIFIKLASPEFIIKRAASVYGAYWRNHGTLRSDPRGPQECDAHFEGLSGMDDAFWEVQLGAIQSALEVSGTRDVKIEVLSSSATGAHYRATWK